jgi:large subunit ribosomal protein L24
MSMHVKKDDMVEVVSGDHRGTRGKILKVDLIKKKVIVQGVNRVYKHVKPSRKNPQGGRVQVEQPVDISNVLPISTKTNRPTRVRFVTDENGEKKRVAVDGSVIDTVTHSKK